MSHRAEGAAKQMRDVSGRRNRRKARREALKKMGGSAIIPGTYNEEDDELTTRPDLPKYFRDAPSLRDMARDLPTLPPSSLEYRDEKPKRMGPYEYVMILLLLSLAFQIVNAVLLYMRQL